MHALHFLYHWWDTLAHCSDITVYYGFVLNALSAVEGFRPMRCFPKFYSWGCFVKLRYEVIISADVTSLVKLCLLWFDVNFCMSYDFSLTSQSCLQWFGVSFCMSYDFSFCFFF